MFSGTFQKKHLFLSTHQILFIFWVPIKSYSSLGSKLNISNTCNLKSSSNPPVRTKLISTILLEYYESIFTIGLITIHSKIPHFFC